MKKLKHIKTGITKFYADDYAKELLSRTTSFEEVVAKKVRKKKEEDSE